MKVITVFNGEGPARVNIRASKGAIKKAAARVVGQRGKTAEKEVQKHLEKLNGEYFDFAFSRLPDARAAGGRLAAVMCDYLCWYRGLSLPLEVKEIAHDFRLPKASLSQLAILKKVAEAGAKPYVLVLFTTIGKWRIAPISAFEFDVPSWDMSEIPTFDSAAEAMASAGFPPLRK